MTRWLPAVTGRRGLVAVGLVAILLVAGVSAVRIADVHGEPDWRGVDTSQEPAGIVDAVRSQLRRVDHRTVTRVHRVDPQTGARTAVLVHEEAYDYSNAQYVANYAVVGNATAAAWAQHHSLLARFAGQYLRDGNQTRALYYADDRSASFLLGRGRSGEVVGAYDLRDRQVVGARRAWSSIAPAYQFPFFLEREANWTVADRGDETLTLAIDDPDGYLAVRRLSGAVDVHRGSRIELVVDASTGRPIRVVERRILTVERDLENGSTVRKRRTFFLETTFGEVGTLDVHRPPGTLPPSLAGLVQDFMRY